MLLLRGRGRTPRTRLRPPNIRWNLIFLLGPCGSRSTLQRCVTRFHPPLNLLTYILPARPPLSPRRKPLSPSKPRAPRRVEASASCAPHCLSSPLCLFVSLWTVVPAGSLRRDPLRLVGGNAAQQTRFPQEVEAGEAFQTRRGESGDCSAGRAAAAGLHVCL